MNKNIPLISVIIPVYNVMNHVRKCLETVCGQTYKALEIIVVDDGSTDGSGSICDEYAAKDCRVKVLHCENGGLSVARNRGMAVASGELLGFVDSDDWIEADMYECLYRHLADYDADISICSYYREKGDVCEPALMLPPGTVRVWNTREAMEEVIRDKKFKNFAWNKLFRREMFGGVEFPAGRKFEDVAVMYRVFANARKTVFVETPLYHYNFRMGSLTKTEYYDVDNYMQMFIVLTERLRFLKTYDESLWAQSLNVVVHKGVQLIDRTFLDTANADRNRAVVDFCRKELALVDMSRVRPDLRLKGRLVVNKFGLYRRLYMLFRSLCKSEQKFKK